MHFVVLAGFLPAEKNIQATAGFLFSSFRGWRQPAHQVNFDWELGKMNGNGDSQDFAQSCVLSI